MIGKLTGITLNLDGSQNVTFKTDSDFRETYDELKDSDVNIEIKKYYKHRSLDANAYAWVLIDKIAQKAEIKKSEVYRNAIKDIGGVSAIVCVADYAVDRLINGWQAHGVGWQTEVIPSINEGFSNVTLWYGSSVYDAGQMSALIDSLKMDAEALGIPTMTEAETNKLVTLWGEKKHG